jgi:hypothetical protein
VLFRLLNRRSMALPPVILQFDELFSGGVQLTDVVERGEVYPDDDTPLDMAIEVAKHAFSRARTHAMRATLSARRLVQRIKKDRRNTVQATLTQMGIQH